MDTLHYSAMLSKLNHGGRIEIKFDPKKTWRISDITGLVPRLIMFEDPNAVAFLGGVSTSGKWHGVTQTYVVMLRGTLQHETRLLATAFHNALESARPIVNNTKNLTELCQANPDVCYDESCFRETCLSLGYIAGANEWMLKLNADDVKEANIGDIILKALPKDLGVAAHDAFMARYVKRFYELVAA